MFNLSLMAPSSLSDSPSTDQLLSLLSKANLNQQTTILTGSESLNTDEMLRNLEQMKKVEDGGLVIRSNGSV